MSLAGAARCRARYRRSGADPRQRLLRLGIPGGVMKNIVTNLQPIGRALMLPIAVLPAAALLLRLGQPDVLNLAAMAAAGGAIFSNLGLLFAIGVAVGLARENHGAAGLAAVVGFLVATQGAEVLLTVPADVAAAAAGVHQDVV